MTEDENMDKLEWAEWFERMFEEWATPESKLRSEKEDRFLREVIYAGLKDLNTGFDSPLIGHFSPEDFLTVLDRCESLNVRIIGIEVSTTDVEPPSKLQLAEIQISPEPGYDWARRLVQKFTEESDMTICATFKAHALAKSNSKQKGEPAAMKNDREDGKPERHMWEPRDPNDEPLTPGSHEQLWQIAVRLPTDFEPYGQRKRDVAGDCSGSCRWLLPLVAMPKDWGVCGNAASPRVGLLTFEHQGCPQYEMEEEEEEEEEEIAEESTPPQPSLPNLEPENQPKRGMLIVDETLLGLVPFLTG